MYLTFEQVLALSSMKDVQVYAGAEGLYRTISWTQVLELDEIEAWVRPGALVFVTGVAVLQWKKSIADVIRQAINSSASGMVIYLGPYIKEVPEEACQLCEEEKFPLLTAPMEVRSVDVSYQMAEVIFSNQGYWDWTANAVSSVYINQITDNTSELFDKLDFCGEGYQSLIFQLKGEAETGDLSVKLRDIENLITGIFDRNRVKVLSKSEYGSVIVLAAYQAGAGTPEGIADQILERYRELFQDDGLYVFAGALQERREELGQSMRYAVGIRKVHRNQICREKRFLTYKDLGIYRLLNSDDLASDMEAFIRDYLGALLETANQELLYTLDCYIRNGQHLAVTAEEMFLHVNTLKYRLRRVEELLQCSLRDSTVIHNLYIALAICRYQGKL